MRNPLGHMMGLVRKYRPIIVIGIIALLAELGYATMNQSALPPYVVKELQLKEAWLGWIMATFLLVESVFRPALGGLGDRIGRKPLLIAGSIASGVSALLMTRAADPSAIVWLRVLDGLGAAAIWPTAYAFVGDTVAERNRSLAMSVINVSYMIGIALGPLMGGVISEYGARRLPEAAGLFDYGGHQQYVFYAVAIVFALTAAVALLLLKKPDASHGRTVHGEKPVKYHLSDLLYSLRAIPHMLAMVFVAFLAIGLLIPVVKLYAMDGLGMTEKQYGQLLLPVAGILAVLALPLGRLGDKWGKVEAVRLGVTITAIAMWTIAAARSTHALIFAGSLLGIGFLMAMPSWLALISDLTSSSHRGQVLGAVGMAQGFGAIIGVVVSGYLYDGSLKIPGVSPLLAPMVVSAGLLTISAALTFIFLKRAGASRT